MRDGAYEFLFTTSAICLIKISLRIACLPLNRNLCKEGVETLICRKIRNVFTLKNKQSKKTSKMSTFVKSKTKIILPLFTLKNINH